MTLQLIQTDTVEIEPLWSTLHVSLLIDLLFTLVYLVYLVYYHCFLLGWLELEIFYQHKLLGFDTAVSWPALGHQQITYESFPMTDLYVCHIWIIMDPHLPSIYPSFVSINLPLTYGSVMGFWEVIFCPVGNLCLSRVPSDLPWRFLIWDADLLSRPRTGGPDLARSMRFFTSISIRTTPRGEPPMCGDTWISVLGCLIVVINYDYETIWNNGWIIGWIIKVSQRIVDQKDVQCW